MTNKVFTPEDLQPDEPHPFEHWNEYIEGKVSVLEEIISASPYSIQFIGEIGVRSGYGAVAMMRTAKAKAYHGWDNWCSIVGISGKEWAEKLLDPYYARIHTNDTQILKSLSKPDIPLFDVFHVDGCHQPPAVQHDMDLAWEMTISGGWLIMDDYNYDHVKKGVDGWMEKNPDKFSELQHYELTMRGDLVLKVQKNFDHLT